MANLYIELADTPSDFSGDADLFVRVNNSEDGVVHEPLYLYEAADTQMLGAYAPETGEALIFNGAVNKWRPGSLDIYSAGDGISKNGLNLSIDAPSGGGLISNVDGLFIAEVGDISGTYGNSTVIPVVTVNDRGQVTQITTVAASVGTANTFNTPYVGDINGTSGQIVVTGADGSANANVKIDLVATGITSGTYGDSVTIPKITVDSYGRLSEIVEVPVGLSSDDNGNITIIDVPLASISDYDDTGVQDGYAVLYDGSTQEYVAGPVRDDRIHTVGISDGEGLVWNAANSRLEPGAVNTNTKVERFKILYSANGDISNITSLTEGIANVSILNAYTGEINISFDGYHYPPASILFYGYDYTNNKYTIVPLETTMGLRELPGGGVSGSPTAFDSGTSIQIRLRVRENETGARRGTFGTTTHAWAQFVMYD